MLEEKNEKMLRNLYNIQRMAFNLDKQNIGIDMIRSFESTARKIDEIEQKEYNEVTSSKFDKEDSLERELVRLKDLIAIISERIEKRNSLYKDFEIATGATLESLEKIRGIEDLEKYTTRYNDIKKYLESKEKIEILEEELAQISESLADEEKIAEANLKNNKHFEADLEIKLNSIAISYPYLTEVNDDNLQEKMELAKNEVGEAENALDAFNVAFNTIKNSGISIEQTSRYDEDANEFRKNYYETKKRDIALKIYSIVHSKIKLNYEEMLFKRDKIKNLIVGLAKIKYEYSITDNNFLEDFEFLLEKQYESIKEQFSNISTIKKLNEKLSLKQTKLEEYKQVINDESVENILIEYNIIEDKNKIEEKVNNDFSEVSNSFVPFENIGMSDLTVTKLKPNTIVAVSPPYNNMNLGVIKTKTNVVMSRVSSLLGIKKVASQLQPVVKEPVIEQEVLFKSKPVSPNMENIAKVELTPQKVTSSTPVVPQVKIEEPIFQEKAVFPDLNTNNAFFDMPDLPIETGTNNSNSDTIFPF